MSTSAKRLRYHVAQMRALDLAAEGDDLLARFGEQGDPVLVKRVGKEVCRLRRFSRRPYVVHRVVTTATGPTGYFFTLPIIWALWVATSPPVASWGVFDWTLKCVLTAVLIALGMMRRQGRPSSGSALSTRDDEDPTS